MKTPEPTPLVSEPLISDEQMKEAASKISAFKDTQATFLQGQRYAARIYESDRAKLIAERDEYKTLLNSISITANPSNTSGQYEVDERLIGKMNTLLSKYK